MEIAQEIGDRYNEANSLNNLGFWNYPKFEISEPYFLQGIKIADETGLLGRQLVLNYLYTCIIPMGKLEAGLRLFYKGLEKSRLLGYETLSYVYQVAINICLLYLGQYERVAQNLDDEFLAKTERIRGPNVKWFNVNRKGWCKFLASDKADGLELMALANEQMNAISSANSEMLTNFALAKSYQTKHSDWEKGLRVIEKVVKGSLKIDHFTPYYYLSTKSRLYLKLGELKKSLETSTELVENVENNTILNWRELFFFTHAQALRAYGKDEKADQYLTEAYERVMMVAGKTEDEGLRRSYLENVPWNREILQEAEARGMVTK